MKWSPALRGVVVILLRIHVDLLPVAPELQVEAAAKILIELTLYNPFLGEIIRLERSIDHPRILGIRRRREDVRAVKATGREVRR